MAFASIKRMDSFVNHLLTANDMHNFHVGLSCYIHMNALVLRTILMHTTIRYNAKQAFFCHKTTKFSTAFGDATVDPWSVFSLK